MRQISLPTRALVDRLYAEPALIDRVLGRSRLNLAVLEALAGCGEAAAIPYLVPILVSGTRSDIQAAAAAIGALLAQATGDDLAGLDESARRSWVVGSPIGGAWRRLAPRELAQWVGPGEPGALLLRFSSFHANGFVREEAVRRLALIEDGNELPYLLLRVNDWVREVRNAAHCAVRARLRLDYIEHFVRNLALVIRLETAQRVEHGDLLASIYQLLADPAARGAMIEAMSDGCRKTRRAAFRLLAAGNPDALQPALLAALKVADPLIRVWGARKIATTLSQEQRETILRSLLLDSCGSVRLEALNAWVTFFADDATAKLLTALMDPSASVREFARFQLRARAEIDFARCYRDAMAATNPGRLATAIAGLADTGTLFDADCLIPYLSHLSARVRRAAVRAIARLGGDRYRCQVMERVLDAAPSVSAQARRVLQVCAATFSGVELWSRFEAPAAAHVRMNLLHLLAALPKWESLPYLIHAVNEKDAAIASLARQFVARWNSTYNRSQSAPSQEQLARAAAALSQSAPVLGRREAQEIRFAIDSFSQG